MDLKKEFLSAIEKGNLEQFLTQRNLPNLPISTMGGKVFWEEIEYKGWKLQQNVITGHYRILDHRDIRRAWGTKEEMKDLFRICDKKPSGKLNDWRKTLELPPDFSRITRLPIGTPVYCNLAVLVEHSGIYVGNGKIIHLANEGGGVIEKVTPERFVARLDGMNPSTPIYYACSKETGKPLARKIFAQRAEKKLGAYAYNLAYKNCHGFTRGCITGEFKNVDMTWKIDDITCALMEYFYEDDLTYKLAKNAIDFITIVKPISGQLMKPGMQKLANAIASKIEWRTV